MPERMKVTIRGKTYPDVPTAARELGVAKSTIYAALHRERVDTVGTGPGRAKHSNGGRPAKPLKLGRVEFRSLGEAERALGYAPCSISKILRVGKITSRQNLLRRAMEYHEKEQRGQTR